MPVLDSALNVQEGWSLPNKHCGTRSLSEGTPLGHTAVGAEVVLAEQISFAGHHLIIVMGAPCCVGGIFVMMGVDLLDGGLRRRGVLEAQVQDFAPDWPFCRAWKVLLPRPHRRSVGLRKPELCSGASACDAISMHWQGLGVRDGWRLKSAHRSRGSTRAATEELLVQAPTTANLVLQPEMRAPPCGACPAPP